MDEEIIVKILGVNITNLPLPNIFDHISSAIQLHNRIMLSYVNIHALNLAYSAPWFRDFQSSGHCLLRRIRGNAGSKDAGPETGAPFHPTGLDR